MEFHQSKARYRVAALGRQSGKSTMAMNELIMCAWTRPKTRYWFISPIFSQAKDQFRKAIEYLPYQIIVKKSETELRIDLINGSSIEYKSGEVLDRLRGATLNGVVIDEVRDQNPSLWPMVIRPMLSTTQGWAAFISTPNGYDAFYDLYQMSLTDKTWQSFQSSSICNPFIPQSEFEAAKSTMTDDEFAQEYLAEFREIGKGKAYKKHSVRNQSEENPFSVTGLEWSPYLPIIVGCDFNVGIMVWELMQKKAFDFHVGDEIAMENTDTDDMAKVLVERVRNHPPGVIIIGDASGKSRKTSAAGATDYSIIMQALKAANIPAKNLTPESNPMIKDRLNIVNGRLLSADGFIHCTYNPRKCKRLKMDLERVVTKAGSDGVSLDKSNVLLTHSSDAFGYPLCYYSKEWKEKPSTLRVIER